jgi:hypothetical protein
MIQEDGEFYWLQPIVVKEKTWKERGAGKDASVTGWELIDGQQRSRRSGSLSGTWKKST